jgi:hypothetical protein
MITSAFFGIILLAINSLIGYFPDIDEAAFEASGIPSAFATLNTWLGQANVFFPVSDLLICLNLFLTVELSIVVVKTFLLLWKMVRG